MSARAFRQMTRRAMKHLHEPGAHRWFRHDGPVGGDVIDLIFNPNHIVTDAEGISLTAPASFAWIMLSRITAVAPERTSIIDSIFDDEDRLEIAGRRYRAESCRLHSHDLLEVELIEER